MENAQILTELYKTEYTGSVCQNHQRAGILLFFVPFVGNSSEPDWLAAD